MKTETEWQARALEVAQGYGHCKDESTLHKAILNFAKEYAAELQTESDAFAAVIQNDEKQRAEALAEVDRLKDDNAVCRDAIEGAYLLVEDWARDDSNGSDMDQGAARATLRCLNEAVGKAAPLLLKERLEGQQLYGLRWKELKQEIADLRADVGRLEKALRVPGAGFAECLNIVDRLMDESDNRAQLEVAQTPQQWKRVTSPAGQVSRVLVEDAAAGPVKVPDGWQMVPSVATREMELYGTNLMLRAEEQGGRAIAVDIYAEMLSAAPAPPKENG